MWRRRGRISRLPKSVMSRPMNTTLPLVGAISRIISFATVDFPQPDSPTSPNASPSEMERLTPSTAFNWRRRPTIPSMLTG